VRVIERALSKDPDGRFATAIAMRQALEACRGAERTEHLRAPTLSPLPMISSLEGTDDKTSDYDSLSSIEARTSAYAVPSVPAFAAGLIPPAVIVKPTKVVVKSADSGQALGAGSHPTFGFFSKAVEPADTPVPALSQSDEPELSLPGKSNKLVMALVAGALIALAAWAAVTFSGTNAAVTPSTAEPANAAQLAGVSGQPAAVGQPAAPVAVTASPRGADAVAVLAPVEPTGSAPQAGVVKLVSDPPGALVAISGKIVGVTPLDVQVVGTSRVTAHLSLNAYRDLDVEVGRSDGPVKTVQLRATTPVLTAPVVKKTVKSGKSGKLGQGHSGEPTKTKSALEERL